MTIHVTDVAIVGGGMVGGQQALGLALGRRNRDLP